MIDRFTQIDDLIRKTNELIEIQTKVLEKLTFPGDTPQEIIKRYYPDARPQNEIKIYHDKLEQATGTVFSAQNPWQGALVPYFTEKSFFILSISCTGIGYSLEDTIASNGSSRVGIRWILNDTIYPLTPYSPYSSQSKTSYIIPRPGVKYTLNFTPPLHKKQNSYLIIEMFKDVEFNNKIILDFEVEMIFEV